MNKVSPFVLIIFLIAGYFSSYAQKPKTLSGRPKIDSLLKELYKAKDDTNKCNILKDLSFAYSQISLDTGIQYGRQDSVLASRLGWKKGIAWADNSLGANYDNKSEYSKSLLCYNEALRIFEELDYRKGIAIVTDNIGNVYADKSDYPRALEYYSKALKMDEEIGNKEWIATVTCNIGTIYQQQSNYPEALEYFFKALEIDEEMGNTQSAANDNGNIGNVYMQQSDYSKALEYYFKQLKIVEEIGEKLGVVSVTSNIGSVYCDGLKDYGKSLEYFFRALKAAEELGNKYCAATNVANVGYVYRFQHNYPQAVAWHFKALQMFEDIGDKNDESDVLRYIGSDYIDIATWHGGMSGTARISTGTDLYVMPFRLDSLIPHSRPALLHKAVECLDKAIVIDMELHDLNALKRCYSALSTADSLLGDYKGALDAHIKYTNLKDSIFSKDNTIKIARLEMQKKQQADSLKAEQGKQVAELRYRAQRSYTYIGAAGIIALLAFSVFIVKERRKSDRLLLNILPAEVANELKANGSAPAKHFDHVTVLFTDFVGFTQASARMKPQMLIEELDTCFKRFDEITAKYKVEKIKTIGDAYLAVCGLPTADPEHAKNIVKAAIEINAFMQDRLAKLGNSTFDVRIGIHSGSVVAGIVGVRKFAYDIWGDTVNTAARMEQNSEPGKINISATTYELVKGKFSCTCRGEIEVKGKGGMLMYYMSAGAYSA